MMTELARHSMNMTLLSFAHNAALSDGSCCIGFIVIKYGFFETLESVFFRCVDESTNKM